MRSIEAKIKFFILINLGLISIYAAFILYSGSALVCLVFSAIFCGFLFRGAKISSFFMLYLAALMWLGFWFKFVGALIFNGGILFEPVGIFDYSPSEWDEALMYASAGGFGFLVSSFFVKKSSEPWWQVDPRNYFKLSFYWYWWVGLVFFSAIIFILNVNYGIFQRAGRMNPALPIYLSAPIKWALFMGIDLAALSLLFIGIRARLKNLIPYLLLALLLDLFCNIATLSRAFPLTGAVIALSFFIVVHKYGYKESWKSFVLAGMIYILFSALSVLSVNYIRSIKFDGRAVNFGGLDVQASKDASPGGNFLFNRWVGLEGVAAVSAYPQLNFSLLIQAAKERKTNSEPSFYDKKIILANTPYLNIRDKPYYAITLPGLIGFLTYSGSIFFVFISTFVLGSFGLWIEKCSWIFTKNTLATSFLSFLWAYRYASFGYAPGDSYLIIFSFMLAYCLSVGFKYPRYFWKIFGWNEV